MNFDSTKIIFPSLSLSMSLENYNREPIPSWNSKQFTTHPSPFSPNKEINFPKPVQFNKTYQKEIENEFPSLSEFSPDKTKDVSFRSNDGRYECINRVIREKDTQIEDLKEEVSALRDQLSRLESNNIEKASGLKT